MFIVNAGTEDDFPLVSRMVKMCFSAGVLIVSSLLGLVLKATGKLYSHIEVCSCHSKFDHSHLVRYVQ